ncbi:MAG: ATP-binding protein [Vampirovibrionales bacterium]|nr:ATP-binding protein [Vampirovibrionales bacterium]
MSKQKDIENLFCSECSRNMWREHSIIIINLDKVNLEMKKTIPLLLCKRFYNEHKQQNKGENSLTFIIDEAHNILSSESFREAESWRDYRLETFEEIIKEGRKFGVFLTIASQRPSDISETITSQAHNYFIHRLINEKDLKMISKAVSYIDKVTEDSIPKLPTGTCILSGVTTQFPLKLKIDELHDNHKPQSKNYEFFRQTSSHQP